MSSLNNTNKSPTENNNIMNKTSDDNLILDNPKLCDTNGQEQEQTKMCQNNNNEKGDVHIRTKPSGREPRPAPLFFNDNHLRQDFNYDREFNYDYDSDIDDDEVPIYSKQEYVEIATSQYNDEQRDYFVAKLKRELSLPSNIRIPDHFINKRLSLRNIEYSKKTDKSEENDSVKPTQEVCEHTNDDDPSDSIETQKTIDNNYLNEFFHEDYRSLSRKARQKFLQQIGYGQDRTYKKVREIGSGSYSCVYQATSSLTGEMVALKEIEVTRDEGLPFTAIREVSILKELKHANIITLHDFIYTRKFLKLVFEYLMYDLSVYQSRCVTKMIDPRNVKIFLFQLLRALEYCHRKNVLHRDIKPQNILLNEIGEIKLADFGLARATSVPIKTFTEEVVTLWYRPPDVLLGNTTYGPSIDMWGVGCIFCEISDGGYLFTGSSPEEQLSLIFSSLGKPDNAEWPNFDDQLKARDIELDLSRLMDFNVLEPRIGSNGVDLLRKLLKCEPNLRISSIDAMNHNYFSTLPEEVYKLSDCQSIFSIESIKLVPEEMIEPPPIDNYYT